MSTWKEYNLFVSLVKEKLINKNL